MTDPQLRSAGLGRPRGPHFLRPGVAILPGDHGSPRPAAAPGAGGAGTGTAAGGTTGAGSGGAGVDEPSALNRWLTRLAVVACGALLLLGGYQLWNSMRTDTAGAEQPPRVAAVPPAESLRDVAAAVLPSVVQVEVETSSGDTGAGSGFVVDGEGHIVTNAHVLEDATRIRVTFASGERAPARLVGASVEDDIAVLEVELPAGVPPLALGRSADVRVGDDVLAVGSPLGLTGTVTAGIISAVDREVTLGTRTATALQTDASINPGNSGGPLVGMSGQVVGVTTTIATLPAANGGSIGIGFAIPVDRAASVTRRLIEDE